MIGQKSGTVVPSYTSSLLEEMSLNGTFSPEQEAVIQDTAGTVYSAGSNTACSKNIELYQCSSQCRR